MTDAILPQVRYELTLDKPEHHWIVESVWLSEFINQPFRATIDVATESEVTLECETLLGASAILTICRDTLDPQFVCGIVSEVHYLGYVADALHLRLSIVSAFELLRQEVGSRIWQGASPLTIIKELLGPGLGAYQRSFDVGEVSRGQKPREYCVQYRESVYDFVCRLLEEEGISYSFRHDGSDKKHEILLLSDANDQYPSIEVDAPPPLSTDTLAIVPNNQSNVSFESLQGIEWSRSLTSTSTLRRDFDWTKPEEPLTAKAKATDVRGRNREVYAHTERRFFFDDLDERAKDLQAAQTLRAAVCRGHGNVTLLRPGMKFKIAGEGLGDLAPEYIVLGVNHSGQREAGGDYANNFECIPSIAEIRPMPVTPKPRVHGPHTAIVTGDDEIHTDEHGRIQVQFSWEVEPSYESGSSCWIRCAQSWSGAGWGTQFIPRVGMEVVVEFIEGNPDRPLVVGCVYDGSREHPFKVPDLKTQSGWRTRSSPNSEGFNELRFEDAAGSEEIYVHAQRNLRTEVEAAESRSVGGARSTTIVGDDVLEVSEGDGKVTIKKGTRTTEIGEGDDVLTIKQGSASKKVPTGTDAIEAKIVNVKAETSLTLECGGSKLVMTPSEVKIESALIKLN